MNSIYSKSATKQQICKWTAFTVNLQPNSKSANEQHLQQICNQTAFTAHLQPNTIYTICIQQRENILTD